MVVSGRISEERECKVPAAEAWKVYGSLQLAEVAAKSLPDLFSKIEVVEGDGGPGTILELFFAPGKGYLRSYKEKFTVVDDEKRVKEVQVVEGGYLEFGFKAYRVRLEVIEPKGKDESGGCVTRASVEYELKDEIEEGSAEAVAATQMVSIQPIILIMEAAAAHLQQNCHN